MRSTLVVLSVCPALLAATGTARAQVTHAAPRLVPASSTSAATEAELRRDHASGTVRVLGEAALAAGGGTIGVGTLDAGDGSGSVAVVAVERAHACLFALATHPSDGNPATWTRLMSTAEASFADVDGDGRTDVVLWFPGLAAGALPFAQVFLAPDRSAIDRCPSGATLFESSALSFSLRGASSASSAATAALASPTGPVAHGEACTAIHAASTPAGAARVSAPGAVLLSYQEPGLPTFHATSTPLATASSTELAQITSRGAGCPNLHCDAHRPYCTDTPSEGPGGTSYWFTRVGGRLRLLGVAVYSGS